MQEFNSLFYIMLKRDSNITVVLLIIDPSTIIKKWTLNKMLEFGRGKDLRLLTLSYTLLSTKVFRLTSREVCNETKVH
jgi:hypothetical protein